MPKRKRKNYNRPKKIYDKARIDEEDLLVKKYGLKNKREIWKADFAIGKIRNMAKKLITSSDERRQEFIDRQKLKGFPVETTADILALNAEDYLKRRLQSIVVKKGLATKHKQARQFITHKHVTIGGNIINSPSHLTTLEEEKNVELNLVLPVKKKEVKAEEEKFLEEMKVEENPEGDVKEESKIEEKPKEEKTE